MGYVSLVCTYTVGGKKDGYRTSRPTKDGEDYLATERAKILKEYPAAKNIEVKEPPFNEGYPYALDGLIDLIQSKRPDITREEIEKLSYMVLLTHRDDYYRGAYITTLPEAKRIFDDADSEYRDWVYFREFGIVIFDVTKHVSHEIFLYHWYAILAHVLPFDTKLERSLLRLRGDYSGEPFLHAKFGFYRTSAYGIGNVIKSANMKLTAAEKAVFGQFRFRDLEPD